MPRRLLALVLALVLAVAACGSSGDDDADGAAAGDTSSTAPAGESAEDDGEPAGSSEPDAPSETEDTTVDQFDFNGYPPPSTRLILGGPQGTAEVSFDCDAGTVTFAVRGAEAGSTVDVEVGSTTDAVEVGDDGTGSVDVASDLPTPTPVAVYLAGSIQRGQLQGCA